MIINSKNYLKFIKNNFTCITQSIRKANNELTANDFKNVFDSIQAKKSKDIIYIFMSKKKIPRLKGASKIIYIGQTKRTLHKRHSSSSNLKASSLANKQKYNDIIDNYGEIQVYYIERTKFNPIEHHQQLSLQQIEGQFLWWYFQNHSEYPPINYTKTKIRTPKYEFITPSKK